MNSTAKSIQNKTMLGLYLKHDLIDLILCVLKKKTMFVVE